MTVCLGFMGYAFSEIIYLLRVAKLISKASIRLQLELFVTLCLQVCFLNLFSIHFISFLLWFVTWMRSIDRKWKHRKKRNTKMCLDQTIPQFNSTSKIPFLLQTLIPLVTLYASCGFTIILPLARIDSSQIARITPLLISCFLPLDTLAVLLSMADYRRELTRILCFRAPPQTVSIMGTTTLF